MHSPSKTSDAVEFDSFNAPLGNAPMPRWQRKALEKSQCLNRPSDSIPPKKPRTPSATKRSRIGISDRFIPCRSATNLDLARMTIKGGKENDSADSAPSCNMSDEDSLKPCGSKGYSACLASNLFDIDVSPSDVKRDGTIVVDRILAFTDKAPEAKQGYLNPNRVLFNQNSKGNGVRKNRFRHIPQTPFKILDAPGLLEDFYLNLMDWSSNNILSVSLGDTVYLWNADAGTIETLTSTEAHDDCITSVSWLQGGNYLAVGTNNCEVQVWDAERMACIRKMRSHSARVGSLAWNGPVLSSGSRDTQIHNHDVRIQDHHVATLAGHSQEICGLKWNSSGTQLASGGNDNIVNIWDNTPQSAVWRPKFTFDHHQAAVKALAWCPWQSNLLATGGGTADRQLRFWNTSTGQCVNSIDTKSQVCSILWSPHEKELVTSHGFSQNQLTVWKYPSLVRIAELKGHTSRVLHTALSPDGKTVVSGAADETIRFWNIFGGNDSRKSGRHGSGTEMDTLSATSSSLKRGCSIR